MMQFNLPKDNASIIKVIGVGGGGSNAVNHMYNNGIRGVDFIVCNTDAQSLDKSPVPVKLQLGLSLTDGKGAGSIPEVGKNAAIESIDDLKAIIENNTSMVFVTAGMGGGTGTGAAPIIAKAAREMGVLTVGIVTIPFLFEGKKRRSQAEEGISQMREAVDTLLIIQNDKLREVYGNLTLKEAFGKADDVLTTAAKGIAEMISVSGFINVDMNDVKTVMQDSGVAIMGSAVAEGENRAQEAVEAALESPLLNDNDIHGAKDVLLNITVGNQDVDLEEFTEITDFIQDAAGETANVIWGYVVDESMGEQLGVTVIATGFQSNNEQKATPRPAQKPADTEEKQKVYFDLDDQVKPVQGPLNSPIDSGISQAPEKATEEPSQQVEEPFLKPKAEESREPQGFLNFELGGGASKPQQDHAPEKRYMMLDEEDSEQAPKKVAETPESQTGEEQVPEQVQTPRITPEQRQQLTEERMQNIRELTSRLRTPSGIAELEKEPAYVRRNFKLSQVKKSSDQPDISKYGLNEDNEIRKNNRFLHDNVD